MRNKLQKSGPFLVVLSHSIAACCGRRIARSGHSIHSAHLDSVMMLDSVNDSGEADLIIAQRVDIHHKKETDSLKRDFWVLSYQVIASFNSSGRSMYHKFC